jgi:hypothetical protein
LFSCGTSEYNNKAENLKMIAGIMLQVQKALEFKEQWMKYPAMSERGSRRKIMDEVFIKVCG